MAKHTKVVTAALVAGMLMLSGMNTEKAHALDVLDGKVAIFGYGDTSFNLSSKNRTEHANPSGDWNSELALLFNGKINSDVSVWAQIFGDKDGIRLDWAFVDYRFNENLQLRGGQIKTPLGVYNEIRDIRFLQLSTQPPLIYSEEADFLDEAFQGASAIYTLDMGADELEFNIFGGQSVTFKGDEFNHNQMVGGRIIYKTPIQGLRLMGSGFTAKTTSTEEPDLHGRSNMLMGSVDFVDRGIDFKAEYAYHKNPEATQNGYYVQGGYTFFEKLTPFVRYDHITTDEEDNGNPSVYQKEITVGVGYKFNSNIAIKAEDHFIRGYGLVDTENGRTSWNLFSASLNYIF